jgi:hypothetical protein
MTAQTRPYRFEIIDGNNTSYIVLKPDKTISYFTGSMVSLALSNLVDRNAAKLTFALQDAKSESEAYEAIRDYVHPTIKVRVYSTGKEAGK